MTRFGKLLVFVNLLLSMVFMAWSLAVLTNQVRWNSVTLDGDKVVGQIDTLNEQINSYKEARERADERWFAQSEKLHALEAQRPINRAFYAESLRVARDGVNANGKAVKGVPLLDYTLAPETYAVKKAAKGQLQLDSRDLMSAGDFQKELLTRAKELQDTQKEIRDLIAKTKKVGETINGTKPEAEAITAAEKGLRVRAADQRRAELAAKQEIEYLQTPITNARVEGQLLKERLAALERRAKELGLGGAAVTMQP